MLSSKSRPMALALNTRHGPGAAGPRFLLLHRRRVWSEGQRVWMGWERKRGKLHELNRLLRGATDTSRQHGRSRTARARRRALTSSRLMPTRDCRARPRDVSSASSLTRSIRRALIPRPDVSSKAMPFCSRASRPHCPPVVRDRFFSVPSRAQAASIPTPRRCRMCIRICSARAPTPARASTILTRSKRRLPAACPTARC